MNLDPGKLIQISVYIKVWLIWLVAILPREFHARMLFFGSICLPVTKQGTCPSSTSFPKFWVHPEQLEAQEEVKMLISQRHGWDLHPTLIWENRGTITSASSTGGEGEQRAWEAPAPPGRVKGDFWGDIWGLLAEASPSQLFEARAGGGITPSPGTVQSPQMPHVSQSTLFFSPQYFPFSYMEAISVHIKWAAFV